MHKKHILEILWANSCPEVLIKYISLLFGEKKGNAFISVKDNQVLPFLGIFSINASVNVDKSALPYWTDTKNKNSHKASYTFPPLYSEEECG